MAGVAIPECTSMLSKSVGGRGGRVRVKIRVRVRVRIRVWVWV